MLNENIETAKTGKDQKHIVKDLLGIKTAGAIAAGEVLSSYGQTPNGAIDSTSAGILLDAAVRENGGTAELQELIIREIITTSGTPQKSACWLYIFDYYDLSIASGSAFAFSGNTTQKRVKAIIKIAEADWDDTDSLDAFVRKDIRGYNIKTDSDTVMLKAVLVMKSTSKTYTANHALQLELRLARD